MPGLSVPQLLLGCARCERSLTKTVDKHGQLLVRCLAQSPKREILGGGLRVGGLPGLHIIGRGLRLPIDFPFTKV